MTWAAEGLPATVLVGILAKEGQQDPLALPVGCVGGR